MAVAMLFFCGCEKETNVNGNTTTDSTSTTEDSQVDITPYLGTHLMTRTAELTMTVATISFPIDRDLDIEMVTIKADPQRQNGIIMTSNDGMCNYGTVDDQGMHLTSDTINLAVDTLGVNCSINVSMTHPTIAAPVNGVMKWTSVASGTATVALPIVGNVTANITGYIHYSTVLSTGKKE